MFLWYKNSRQGVLRHPLKPSLEPVIARPPKSPTDQKSISRRIPVTADERDRIEAKAEAAGLPIATFMRAAVMDERITQVQASTPLTSEQSERLRAIGRRLNDAAKAANSGRDLPDDFEATMQELETLLDVFAEQSISD
jgi:hypothetical protein